MTMTPTLIAMKTLILPEPYPEMKTRLMAAMATVTFADIAVIGRPDARNDTRGGWGYLGQGQFGTKLN